MTVLSDTMTNTFTPRTYGDTLWLAFLAQYPDALSWGFRDSIRRGIREATVTNINRYVTANGGEARSASEFSIALRRNERDAEILLSEGWPSGHSFPRGAIESLAVAVDRLGWPHDLDVSPVPLIGGEITHTNKYSLPWAWATGLDPMPTLGDNPVDSLASYLSRNYGYEYSSALDKAFIALVGQEKARRVGNPNPGRSDSDRAGQPVRDDEPLDPGTRLILAPNPATASGGGVYFHNTTPIPVEVMDYGYSPLNENIRVRRMDGEPGTQDQTVGRQYLSWPLIPTAPVAVDEPVDTVESLREALATAKREHDEDIRLAERIFWQEARSRSWCSEAEDVLGKINDAGSHIKWDTDRNNFQPPRSYAVEVEVTEAEVNFSGYDFTLSSSITVTVYVRDITDPEDDLDTDYFAELIENDQVETALREVLGYRASVSVEAWSVEDYNVS